MVLPLQEGLAKEVTSISAPGLRDPQEGLHDLGVLALNMIPAAPQAWEPLSFGFRRGDSGTRWEAGALGFPAPSPPKERLSVTQAAQEFLKARHISPLHPHPQSGPLEGLA